MEARSAWAAAVRWAYVLRLEVAVEDAARVAVGEPAQDLEQEDLRKQHTTRHMCESGSEPEPEPEPEIRTSMSTN